MVKKEVTWERIFDKNGVEKYLVKSDFRRDVYILYKIVGFDHLDVVVEELGKAKDPPSLYKKFPEVQKLLNERRMTDD